MWIDAWIGYLPTKPESFSFDSGLFSVAQKFIRTIMEFWYYLHFQFLSVCTFVEWIKSDNKRKRETEMENCILRGETLRYTLVSHYYFIRKDWKALVSSSRVKHLNIKHFNRTLWNFYFSIFFFVLCIFHRRTWNKKK